MLPPVLLAAFPDLADSDPAVTHPPDARYNCVAWAAGVTDAWWWPDDPAGYWPPTAPSEATAEAVSAALATVGYVPCGDGNPEPGFDRVAIYVRDGVATHVAVQRDGDRWSSKLGRDCAVSHDTPAALEGAVFGVVFGYLRRPSARV